MSTRRVIPLQVAGRRQDAQDATLAFVSRCEVRFWQAISTGLFFRRRYSVGDDVDVVLCRGLESQRGRIAIAHENETYDVDLKSKGATTDKHSEVGVQIPPEYLRAVGSARVAGPLSDNEKDKLKVKVGDLYRERTTLRKQLDELLRERDALEKGQSQPAKSVDNHVASRDYHADVVNRGIGTKRAHADTSKSSHVEDALVDCRTADTTDQAPDPSDEPQMRANAETPQARFWFGSLSCDGQPFGLDVAQALLPDPGGDPSNADENATDLAKLNDVDIVTVALQECTTSHDSVLAVVRRVLALDDDTENGEWCSQTIESAAESTTIPGSRAATLVICARREVLANHDESLQSAAATPESGLSTVGIYVQLRDGVRAALLTAKVDLRDQDETKSVSSLNAAVAAHFAGNALHMDGQDGHSALDVSNECEHAFFIGDLGYSYDDSGQPVKRRDLVDLVTVNNWSSLASADALKREKAAHHVFSGNSGFRWGHSLSRAGWETVTPRFSPTAFLHSFDADKCISTESPLPCWSERVLWKSLPELRDRVSLELYDKREVALDGSGATRYNHDALVAGFVVCSDTSEPPVKSQWASVTFASLQATFLAEAPLNVAAGADLCVSFNVASESGDGQQTTTALLTGLEDPGTQKSVSWDDEITIRLGDPAAVSAVKHVFVRVYAVSPSPDGGAEQTLIAGCVLSERKLAQEPLTDSTLGDDETVVDIEEPLVSAGVLCGWLHGRGTLQQDPSQPAANLSMAPIVSKTPSGIDYEPAQDTSVDESPSASSATPSSRKASFRSVSKGLKSIVFGRKKK